MSKIWQEIEIKTEDGSLVKAIAPIIISASRSTDIPAFYSKWFFERLEKGYVKWVNPFNRRNIQYVSFEKVRVIVFWSKNPLPITKYLKILDEKGINYYFQFTLNDYEDERFEQGIPSLKERIKTFQTLSNLIGKEKVIWRFDPLILTEKINIDNLLERISKIANHLILYTDKLVYSYVDIAIYKNVLKNILKNIIKEDESIFNSKNILKSEFNIEQKIEFAEKIQKLSKDWRKINPNFKILTCSEDIELEKYDISHNKCIDDDLIIKLFNSDEMLMEFLSGLKLSNKLKDKGQRKDCKCIVSKDIGKYNTCLYNCIYCYANNSKKKSFLI